MIQFKKVQAAVRKTIRQAKRTHWRKFCDTVGNITPVGEVWGIRTMGGNRREWSYPALIAALIERR